MDLGIILRDRTLVVSSLQVAEVFGKRHKRVLEDIRIKIERLKKGEPKIGLTPKDEVDTYFWEETYTDSQGKKRPIYFMTQKGCTYLVMGYTGEKADAYQCAYIEEFDRMQKALEHQTIADPENPTPAQLVEIIRDRLSRADIIIQPKDDELGRDYFAIGIYGLLRYYGHDKSISYPYIRSIRPKVMEIGLAEFEEIVNYCAVKKKLKLPYVRATLKDWQPSEVDQLRPPIFGIAGLLTV
ncbi:Rha family transcriptional regulator [Streptococcus pneumoniae]